MQHIDSVALAIGFGPLAAYLAALGLLNLSGRPFLTTGARDFAALSVAVAGLVFIGPMSLFLPAAAARHFGPYVWALMAALYIFTCTLLVLYQRPRLVIYNLSPRELEAVLQRACGRLDPQAVWTGHHVALPSLGLEFQIEPFRLMRNVSLVAMGEHVEYARAWSQLERALAEELRQVRVGTNPHGVSLLLLSAAMIAVIAWRLTDSPESLAVQLRDLLRLPPG